MRPSTSKPSICGGRLVSNPVNNLVNHHGKMVSIIASMIIQKFIKTVDVKLQKYQIPHPRSPLPAPPPFSSSHPSPFHPVSTYLVLHALLRRARPKAGSREAPAPTLCGHWFLDSLGFPRRGRGSSPCWVAHVVYCKF